MNARDLASTLNLHPRAVLMFGAFVTRMKNKGTLPGLTPHYAMAECPMVQFNGANAIEEANAAEIEANFMETGFPLPSALRPYSSRQGNLIQLAFGAAGQAPTQAAYRALREASGIFNTLANTKRQVWIATLPILTPGSMGVISGRHYVVGIWNEDGAPLWVHPDALAAGLFKGEFPAEQKERNLGEVPATAAPTLESWYEPMRAALEAAGLKGDALHQTILRARATKLMEQGVAPTLEAGIALAQADLTSMGLEPATKGKAAKPAAPAAAPSSTKATGRKLLGRKS